MRNQVEIGIVWDEEWNCFSQFNTEENPKFLSDYYSSRNSMFYGLEFTVRIGERTWQLHKEALIREFKVLAKCYKDLEKRSKQMYKLMDFIGSMTE